jgi:hypothetical protein
LTAFFAADFPAAAFGLADADFATGAFLAGTLAGAAFTATSSGMIASFFKSYKQYI